METNIKSGNQVEYEECTDCLFRHFHGICDVNESEHNTSSNMLCPIGLNLTKNKPIENSKDNDYLES